MMLVATTMAAFSTIYNYEVDNLFSNKQDGAPGDAVTGEYFWYGPDGIKYVTKYVADNDGYRLVY